MAKFKVRIKQVLYATIIVEAENEDEIIEIIEDYREEFLPDEEYMFYSEEIENITKITE